FVDGSVGREIERLAEGTPDRDYKTQLQEIVQRRFGVTPRYGLLESEGPDHDRTFRVEITIQGEPWGLGVGKSKKGAEQAAAEVALAALQVQQPDADGDGAET
ncbi:MAG: ribonuclease III, partial [Candidatus Methylomirabilis sp.]|nr:ribonuclease III [Deltaproteobacteria bacterium]